MFETEIIFSTKKGIANRKFWIIYTFFQILFLGDCFSNFFFDSQLWWLKFFFSPPLAPPPPSRRHRQKLPVALTIFLVILLLANMYLQLFNRHSITQSNNENLKRSCKIYSKLTIKTAERQQWSRSVLLLSILKRLYTLFLVFLLLTLVGLILARTYKISVDFYPL